MLWPHYLRPVPSTSLLEFVHPAQPKISATERIARGTELESVPVDGTPCRFRTCYDVALHPLKIIAAGLEPEGHGLLRVRFELLGGANLEDLQLEPLRLYLHGDLPVTTEIHLWLLRHTREAHVEVPEARGRARRASLPDHPPPVQAAGFAEEEGLFPYPRHSFLGYRLLQEYFALPQKFLFLDVHGLSALAAIEPEDVFELVLHFDQRPPEGLRVLTENLRLHCTPVVNLAPQDAHPIRLDHRHSSYLVRPADPDPSHYEIYSVDRVSGVTLGTAERREYLPFYAFRHGMTAEEPRAIYHKITRKPAVGKPNSDCYISFVTAEERGALPDTEAISMDLTCTNRRLSERLKPGDICRHTDNSPSFADFRNITPVTASVLPSLESGLHWQLISHLSLNYVSLASPKALRGLLSLYNFHALYDRQAARVNQQRLEAISRVEATRIERLFRGAPMRGIHTEIELLEDRFASEGELYLFASVLEEFLALYVTVNAFSQLTVRGAQHGEVYEWPARVGKQFTL
jgi:type VI secretion system protein ImpG